MAKVFLVFQKKSTEETYEKIIGISKNSDFTTSNLLDYKYFSKHYKLISIDLSKQIELENPDLKKQFNFIGKLEEETMLFIIKNQKIQLLIFHKIL